MKAHRFKGIGGWVQWSVKEKKIVYLIVAALVITGIVSLFRMNKDEFPTFQIKQGLVAGVYPGATAQEVEEHLTKPLEQVLFSFKEVERHNIKSVTKDGICYIYVDLNCSQEEKDQVWSKIKLGLEAKKVTLPAGVLAVAVMDEFSNVSAMLVSMESPDKSYSELQDLAESLCAELRKLPVLASASILGGQAEEIAVTIDPDKLALYSISPSSMMLEYGSQLTSLPAGKFNAGDISSNIYVHSGSSSEMEVAERIVYSDIEGNTVRLKDIATIERRVKKPSSFVTHNGNASLIINLEMRPGNNIVAFGKEVNKVLKDFSAQLPESVSLNVISDQPKVVSRSVFSFLRDLLISMLVVIFVMIMMFPLKSALIASSGVPVCSAVAIAIMHFGNIDLNTVTLAALIVVLGMIVDDSIITMDGYMEKLSKGYSRLEAACASAKELFLPTFVATAAICAMFFPMTGIIDGYLGDFVKMFPWVITIALMMSLFYAVSVVPSLEVRFIQSANHERKNFISRAQDRFFDFIQRIYEKAQDFAFRWPRLTLLCGVIAVSLGLIMFLNINIQMMPMAARDYFVVEMELESGRNIDRTKSLADSLGAILLNDDRVVSVSAFVGTGAPRFSATYTPKLPSPSFAQILVNTKSAKATESMLKYCEQHYEHIFPEALIRFKQMDYQAVEAQIEIDLKGDRREDLLPVADRIKTFLSNNANVKWVHSNCDNYSSSLNVELDPEEAARLGVNRALLSLSLSGSMNGQTLASLWEGDKNIPVVLYSDIDLKGGEYSELGNQMVPTTVPGLNVPLRQVASLEPSWEQMELTRMAGTNAVSVFADMKYGQSQPAAMKQVKDFVENELKPELPEGISIEYGGLSSMNKGVVPQILASFLAAVAVLFIFLLFHFKKSSLAALTLLLSSLCFFGAFFGLWLFGLDFTITAVLGLISLVGIIVRNGILLFDYAEEQRFKFGADIRTAAMEAGRRRMRPIFLTSCTTALGVLPMIISGDNLWMPMGVVICFGTILSILLIVLIMPVSYWQIFKNSPSVNPEIDEE